MIRAALCVLACLPLSGCLLTDCTVSAQLVRPCVDDLPCFERMPDGATVIVKCKTEDLE